MLVALVAEITSAYLVVFSALKLFQKLPSTFGLILQKIIRHKATAINNSFLELTFPADTVKTAFATQQLHILLKSLVSYGNFIDKLSARKKPYSLELVATHNDGIRYILMVPTEAIDTVERNLRSYLPKLKIRQIEDYLNTTHSSQPAAIELQLSSDFALPLQKHAQLDEHDPIAYLTGQMTKLAHQDLIAFQIVAVPVLTNTHRSVLKRAQLLRTSIAQGSELSTLFIRQRTPLSYCLCLLCFPLVSFMHVIRELCTRMFQLLRALVTWRYTLVTSWKNSRSIDGAKNPYEWELAQLVKSKLDQQLFEVTIRVLVISCDPETTRQRLTAVAGSLSPFSSAYQSMHIRKHPPFMNSLEDFMARRLSPHHLSQPTILSSSELSDLYHLPNTDVTKTEGLLKSRSPELAAPLSIKHSATQLDLIVGQNNHGGDTVPIGLTREQRLKHSYIIGKTGTGKTTFLKNAIYQDIVNGNGVAVLDPHGDLFHELLGVIPESRLNDVIVFDPSDREWPIGLNIFNPGIEFDNPDDKNDWITSSIIAIFEKLARVDQWGPGMEHILRCASLTVLQLPNPNLFQLERLLTNRAFQKKVAANLKDPVLRQFWKDEFALPGSMQLFSAISPITHRIGHFIATKMTRNIMLQNKSALSISDIMNSGKILLVNLSKGDLGEDQSKFFGTILTSFMWMAAFQRTKIPENQRKDFFIYIDEFQNFATRQFADITSEGRKFHVGLTVSHQNISQIEDNRILKTITANSHTFISMKAAPEDEAFILPYMKPTVESGDIVNLTPYHFYIKTTADRSEDAFSGTTIPLTEPQSAETKDAVIALSRSRYATPLKVVEAYLVGMLAQAETAKKPQKPASTQKPNKPTKDRA